MQGVAIWEQIKDTSNSLLCNVCTTISMAVPISMLVMGSIHLDNCPAERYIPIYLIVSGCFSTLLLLLRVIGSCLKDDKKNKPALVEILSFFICVFLIAWFIAGNVWIYSLNNNFSTESGSPKFCNNTLYQFAFWVTTAVYILIGLSIVTCCCACVVLCIIYRDRDTI